jgi:hypothetical protein
MFWEETAAYIFKVEEKVKLGECVTDMGRRTVGLEDQKELTGVRGTDKEVGAFGKALFQLFCSGLHVRQNHNAISGFSFIFCREDCDHVFFLDSGKGAKGQKVHIPEGSTFSHRRENLSVIFVCICFTKSKNR